MRIIGFWHISMMNHYREIVKEQLELLIGSKLYDNSSMIFICALGSMDNLVDLRKMLSSYNKFVINHEVEIKRYEFPTLEKLYNYSVSSDAFSGYYIHTKGCSFPDNPGGKYWRDYMNHYVITKWKHDYQIINKGYDTCGVKLLDTTKPPVYRTHYSGNFFWFRSDYIKKLINPKELDQKNRFEAEFWVGGANPRAASLCQKFVDYSAKGTFTPPINYVHTLSFNLVSEVERTVANLYKYNDSGDFKHIVVDLEYPLEKGDEYPKSVEQAVENNSKKLIDISNKFGSRYVKLKNIGVSQNWTQVIKHCNIGNDDILIGADPDEVVDGHGWVKAMGNIMRANDRIAVCSVMVSDHIPVLNKTNTKEVFIAGERVWIINGSLNWGIIGISGKFINIIKEIPYPVESPKYGWIESELIKLLNKHNYYWVILPDYVLTHTENNLILRKWKNKMIFETKTNQEDFTEWLKREIQNKSTL